MTTQTVTLELLTTEYNWKIGESGSLKTIRALDKLTIGNVEDGNFTSVTTSNVTSSLFIGNLDGRVGTLSVSGNMSGSVIVEGDGTNATTMNLELELDNVNSTTGSFGNQTSIPTFSVDKYGRVTNVSESTISTTLSLTDDNNYSGSVDLLTGGLNISGTSNQIETSVSGNTYTLSLPDDLNVNNVSLSGNLDVALDSTLNTLTTSGAASMGSTLLVSGDATLNSALIVLGGATMNSNLDVTSNIATPTYIIKDSNSSNTVSLVAPDLSSESSYTLTLPSSDGEDKQFLQTDGAGNLSWVTPESTQQMKGNVITSGNYLTSTTDDISLNNFSVTYTPTLADSSVFLQYKIPYEASIQADQRISFIIKKSVDNGTETLVQKDSLLGPKNATGGMRNLYISNIYDTNTNLIGNTVTYNIYSKLESEVTATDSNGNTKTAGVVLDGTDNFGSFMLNEFAN